jgi:hypothetical protein
MNTVYLAALPLWMIILSVALLLSLAIEGGYRLGAWRHNRERNETERVLIGIRSRIPLVIWTLLLLLALLGVISVGYQAGLTETRRSPIMLALVLAFTIAMALIADLDRGCTLCKMPRRTLASKPAIPYRSSVVAGDTLKFPR